MSSAPHAVAWAAPRGRPRRLAPHGPPAIRCPPPMRLASHVQRQCCVIPLSLASHTTPSARLYRPLLLFRKRDQPRRASPTDRLYGPRKDRNTGNNAHTGANTTKVAQVTLVRVPGNYHTGRAQSAAWRGASPPERFTHGMRECPARVFSSVPPRRFVHTGCVRVRTRQPHTQTSSG